MVERTAELLGKEICGCESGISNEVALNGAARVVLLLSLTLLICRTADNLLASCRNATIIGPTSTFNVADITAGRCDALIAAGLLFEIISDYTVAGDKGGGYGEGRCENHSTIYLQRTVDNSRCWLDSQCLATE